MKLRRARPGLRPRWIQISMLGLLAFCSLVLLIFLSNSVSGKLRELGSAQTDNVQWTMSQVEVEYLDFLSALQRAQVRVITAEEAQQLPSQTDSDESAGSKDVIAPALAELRKRYNIFYSRLETINTSALYRPILDYSRLRERFDALAARTYALVPLIDGTDEALVAALPAIVAAIEPSRHDLRLISTEGNRQVARQADRTREDAARVLRLVAAVGLLLVVAVLWLLFVFWRLYTLNRKRALVNRAMLSRIEAIISTSRDAIIVCDPFGEISDFNHAAELLFGRTRDEAIDLRLGSFLRHPLTPISGEIPAADSQSRPVRPTALLESCAAGGSRSERLLGRDNTGRHFAIELTVDKAEHDGRTILVCFVRNITQRLAAEQELVRSRDKALAGERAKARFLAVMSHEMRTPLNGVLGTVELLGSTELSPQQAEFVDVLRNSGQVLLSHINEVLDITRIESGHVTLDAAPFDLDAMLREIAQSLHSISTANGNRVILPDDEIGTVLGVRTRLRQVLVNLVSNAAKFTRDGEITVEAARLDGDVVEIRVSDTGPGIPEHALATVFDDFVRLTDGGADETEGTGLGLGIARTLVSAMQGEIGAESEFGEGSVFWVRLPLPPATKESASEPPLSAPQVNDSGHASDLPTKDRNPVTITSDIGRDKSDRGIAQSQKNDAGETKPKPEARPNNRPALDVLIVEDNKTNRFIAREMLRRDGHRVTEAHDGVEGVEAAAVQAYDLILMDISMPRMDGVEATRTIRASGGASADSRIIALTAHAQPEDHDRYIAAGMQAVLNKPLRWAVLRDMLYSVEANTEVAEGTEGSDLPDLDAQVMAEMQRALPAETIIRLTQEFFAEGDTFMAALDDMAHLAPSEARAALHGFAGSCATFGGRALHDALGQAETCASGGTNWQDRSTEVLRPLPALWLRLKAGLESGLSNMAQTEGDETAGDAKRQA